MEGTVLGIFKKLDAMVDASNVEDCHWIRCSKGPKKVIVNLSRQNDAKKIRLSQKGLKRMNLSSLDINSTVHINHSIYLLQNLLG